MDLQKGDEPHCKFHCQLPVSELRYFKYVFWYPKSCEWLLLYILFLLSLSLNISILIFGDFIESYKNDSTLRGEDPILDSVLNIYIVRA